MPFNQKIRKRLKHNVRIAVFPPLFFLVMILISPVPNVFSKSITQLSGPENFSRLSEKAGPAVVNIRTERTIEGGGPVYRHYYKGPRGKEDPFNPFSDHFLGDGPQKKYKERSLGSGFIVDKYGHIATNHHVIKGAYQITVRLHNGKEFDAEIIGSDPYTDLALIKVDSKRILPVISMGNSDHLKVGEWVAAIGNPFGLEHTMTVGIVSGKGRVIGLGLLDDFIQTDVSINPGNSGGPLLNVKGEVVGINSAMYAGGSGIGFAVPVNIAKEVFQQLKEYGEMSRGWLGVKVQNMDESIYEYFGIKDGKGVLVVEVFEGSPADDAGIEVNDILIEINDSIIKRRSDIPKVIFSLRAGDVVNIKVLRDGKENLLKAKVAKREDVDVRALKPSKGLAYKFDIKVSDISPETADRFNITDSTGVIVENVEFQGKGVDAGIHAGDVIKEVNHQVVNSLNEYKGVIRNIEKGETVQFLIQRKPVGFLVLNLKK